MNTTPFRLALATLLALTAAHAKGRATAEATSTSATATATATASASGPGYVDGSAFRALIDESKEVVEVNLDGPILQAIANKKKSEDDEGTDSKELFGKLKSIHAVIGTLVKRPCV